MFRADLKSKDDGCTMVTPIIDERGVYMQSEAQKRAKKKYDDAKTVQIKMKLNKSTDGDILAKLDSVPNKQGYLKDLIRADIKGSE